MQVITIGLDIAKSVFQVHGEAASGKIVIQKRLRRSQVTGFFAKPAPALVGIETCGTAHYWGRTLRALGHEVRLIPAAGACPRAGQRPDPWVKPFVKRNKTDARDAWAFSPRARRPRGLMDNARRCPQAQPPPTDIGGRSEIPLGAVSDRANRPDT